MCENVWRNCWLPLWGRNKEGFCNELHCPSAPEASALAPQSPSHLNEGPQCEAQQMAAVMVPYIFIPTHTAMRMHPLAHNAAALTIL